MTNLNPMNKVAMLNSEWRTQSALQALQFCIQEKFPGRIAVTSSFGTESAVLLDLVAKVDPNTLIFFLETEKHFKATLDYRDQLIERFNLTQVVIITPDEADIANHDPAGELYKRDTDKCCEIRKVLPLDKALRPVEAWITGRKRYQNSDREDMPIFEVGRVDKVKINPLANWNEMDIRSYMEAHNLPVHPLAAQGYPSIGCEVCTSRVKPGEDSRAGRWRGTDKTECGIHVSADGKIVRKLNI